MENEKVKEIKKSLQQEIHLTEYVDSAYSENVKLDLLKDVLTLINELETENERLMKLQARGGCRVAELGIENQQLKDRIAELEDKIESGTLIELPRNKIKIRDDNDADWNSQNFPKGSGGPYDYGYKGEE